MIERGSGRTSGLTDWQLFDVPTMWTTLADQETASHWRHVAGWRKTCDLTLTHLSRLREYRRSLAEAWPPETNEAARAYIGRLDLLIEKVQQTHDTAAANYTVFAAATSAITTTRAELKKVYDEYVQKRQQKQEYDDAVADPKIALGSRRPGQGPPVTDTDLEHLNVRARGIMFGLSGELQQAQALIRQPPTYKPNKAPIDSPSSEGPGAGTPVIPPIMPVPLKADTFPLERRIRTRPVSQSSVNRVGPILGATSSNPAASTGNPAQTSPIQGSGSNLSPGLNISPRPDIPGTSSTNGQIISNAKPGGTLPPAGNRPMPPGGIIGGMPGSGFGQPTANGSAPARRINPIGGVIGGGGAGTAPTGGAGSRPGPGTGRAPFPMGHVALPPFDSPSQSRNPSTIERNNRWDPDNPWATDTGVAPVVLPPDDDGRIDPGPAIGFER